MWISAGTTPRPSQKLTPSAGEHCWSAVATHQLLWDCAPYHLYDGHKMVRSIFGELCQAARTERRNTKIKWLDRFRIETYTKLAQTSQTSKEIRYPPTPASHRGSAPEESAKAHGTRWHTGWCHPAWFCSIGNGNFWAFSISQMLFRNQPAKLDTQRWFLQYRYIRGAVLGRHVGHDSCCCSAVSQPANGLSKLVSAIGRCGISFVFFRASVRNVRDSGRCAGKACWARILLLFGRFGTSQWTVKAGFCNG